MPLPPRVLEALIHEPQHALHGEAAGFGPHDRPLDAGLATAFGNGFRKQHNRANHFVIVLNIVHELQLVLRKILCSRHGIPPSRDCSRRTTREPLWWQACPWQDAGGPATAQQCRHACMVSEQRGKTRLCKLLYTTKIGVL